MIYFIELVTPVGEILASFEHPIHELALDQFVLLPGYDDSAFRIVNIVVDTRIKPPNTLVFTERLPDQGFGAVAAFVHGRD